MSGSSSCFDSSPSSSTDSTSPDPSTRDLSWPFCDIPTNPTNRNEADEQRTGRGRGRPACLFVKVYMEGMPIGRKLDLYALHSYNDLLATLSDMFGISIYSTGYADMTDSCEGRLFNYGMLVYEDMEGDWMMVGDVPWKVFLTTVKRLKITNPYCWNGVGAEVASVGDF